VISHFLLIEVGNFGLTQAGRTPNAAGRPLLLWLISEISKGGFRPPAATPPAYLELTKNSLAGGGCLCQTPRRRVPAACTRVTTV